MARLNFDATQVPEDEGRFELLPVGEYLLQVIESEMKPNSKGTGELLKLTLQVLEGPYTNRQLWDNLNIVNDSAEAERIANRSLADLMLLVGLSHINDSEELHFKPFRARVNIREDKSGQYGPSNAVKYRAPRGPGRQPARAGVPQHEQFPRQAAAPARAQGTTVTAPATQQRAASAPQQQAPAPAPRNGGPKPWMRPPIREAAPVGNRPDDDEKPF